MTSDHLSLASLPCTVMTTGDGPEGAGAGACGFWGTGEGVDVFLADTLTEDDDVGCTVRESCGGNHDRSTGWLGNVQMDSGTAMAVAMTAATSKMPLMMAAL